MHSAPGGDRNEYSDKISGKNEGDTYKDRVGVYCLYTIHLFYAHPNNESTNQLKGTLLKVARELFFSAHLKPP